MLFLHINDELFYAPQEEDQTLAGLLRDLRSNGPLSEEEKVLAVQMDNDWVERYDLELVAHQPLGGISELAVRTGDLQQCALALLEDAADLHGVITESISEYARRYRYDFAAPAPEALSALVGAVRELLGCLRNIEESCRLSDVPTKAESGRFEDIASLLGEIESCRESGEDEYLASLLQFRLQKQMAGLGNTIDQLEINLAG
jgi:hypothetical protein